MGTTVIFQNIPLECSRRMFLTMLDSHGFSGRYDFVYIPRDFKHSFGLGYAFVNLVTHEDALSVQQDFNGFRDWAIPCQKVCLVEFSKKQQGLNRLIKRFRNSSVMHGSVPDEYKPL